METVKYPLQHRTLRVCAISIFNSEIFKIHLLKDFTGILQVVSHAHEVFIDLRGIHISYSMV